MERKTEGVWAYCPHCNKELDFDPIECGTAIHGYLEKENYKQIDPHASRAVCEKYIRENAVAGCGKRILIIKSKETGKFIVKPVDYES